MHRWWIRAPSWPCRCVKVPDGDTILVDWKDAIPKMSGPYWIRLARIDAAELTSPPTDEFLAARDALRFLILGQCIVIMPTRSWPDPYRRIIAEVLYCGLNISDELLRRGLVKPYTTGRSKPNK